MSGTEVGKLNFRRILFEPKDFGKVKFGETEEKAKLNNTVDFSKVNELI